MRASPPEEDVKYAIRKRCVVLLFQLWGQEVFRPQGGQGWLAVRAPMVPRGHEVPPGPDPRAGRFHLEVHRPPWGSGTDAAQHPASPRDGVSHVLDYGA